jgi:hypothetical protein
MDVTQELIDEQIQCWNCEETVHGFSSHCPYCRADIHRHPILKASPTNEKITPIPRLQTVEEPPVIQEHSSTFSFILCLLFLVAGSAMFFLAIAITLFARNGSFTISWPENNWTAFLGLGITFVSLGILFLQRLSDSSSEA